MLYSTHHLYLQPITKGRTKNSREENVLKRIKSSKYKSYTLNSHCLKFALNNCHATKCDAKLTEFYPLCKNKGLQSRRIIGALKSEAHLFWFFHQLFDLFLLPTPRGEKRVWRWFVHDKRKGGSSNYNWRA